MIMHQFVTNPQIRSFEIAFMHRLPFREALLF